MWVVCPHHSWSGLCSSFRDASSTHPCRSPCPKGLSYSSSFVFHPNVQMIDETERVPFHRRWEFKRYQDLNPRPKIWMLKFKTSVRKGRVLEVSAVSGQHALIIALPNCFLRLFSNNWGCVQRHSSFFTNLISSLLSSSQRIKHGLGSPWKEHIKVRLGWIWGNTDRADRSVVKNWNPKHSLVINTDSWI